MADRHHPFRDLPSGLVRIELPEIAPSYDERALEEAVSHYERILADEASRAAVSRLSDDEFRRHVDLLQHHERRVQERAERAQDAGGHLGARLTSACSRRHCRAGVLLRCITQRCADCWRDSRRALDRGRGARAPRSLAGPPLGRPIALDSTALFRGQRGDAWTSPSLIGAGPSAPSSPGSRGRIRDRGKRARGAACKAPP